MIVSIGRDERIRTSDPLHPMQVRYQAAPRPDSGRILNTRATGCNFGGAAKNAPPRGAFDDLGGPQSAAITGSCAGHQTHGEAPDDGPHAAMPTAMPASVQVYGDTQCMKGTAGPGRSSATEAGPGGRDHGSNEEQIDRRERAV